MSHLPMLWSKHGRLRPMHGEALTLLVQGLIKKLWGTMEAESPNLRNFLRLPLLLGQRSMETMSMRVEDIDQE